MVAMYEFDAALQATATGEGTWATTIADGWDFAGIPNGGLIMSLVAARLGSLTGHPDPVTVTAHV